MYFNDLNSMCVWCTDYHSNIFMMRITRYCNIVKLLHDVKVLVLCESRIVLDIKNDHDEYKSRLNSVT